MRPSARIVSCLSAAVLAAAESLVLAAGPASAATCASVDVVFAHGTGEPAGPGSVGRPFIREMTTALAGRSISSYAVNYPASFNQNAAPGATDMTNHLHDVAARCTGTVFVLGGYSQGATVVDQAIGIRTWLGNGQAIPSELADRVAAVVVYGNPLNASGRTIAGSSPTYGPKPTEYCNRGDSGRGTTEGSHLSYQTSSTIPDGARFAASRVAGS